MLTTNLPNEQTSRLGNSISDRLGDLEGGTRHYQRVTASALDSCGHLGGALAGQQDAWNQVTSLKLVDFQK